MRLGGLTQSGYTLVEIVMVIALSAVFIIMVIQNTATTKSTEQFVTAIEKVKSVIHDAETQGQSGEASSSNISGFLCGTRLRIFSNGTYRLWRIYGSSDTSSPSNVLTYQDITGGVAQQFSPYPMDIQSQIAPSDPSQNTDKTFAGSPVSQTIDFVFLGAIPSQPIGQTYVYLDTTQEAGGGVSGGNGNCSDFTSGAGAANLYNAYFNVYSGGSGSNHTQYHASTLVVTTASGSVRNQVLR